MRHSILVALAGAALLAGCGGDDADGQAKSTTAATAPAAKKTDPIRIADFLYSPSPATVRAGTRIAIVNEDAAPHTVTDAGAGRTFDSGTVKGKKDGSVTFRKPGTHAYFCEFHPYMKGKVIVTR